jgi:hypothetical protein
MGVEITAPGPFVSGAGSQTQIGNVTSPGAGANISGTIAVGNLPQGIYDVTVQTYMDGTPVAGTDDDNMKINQSGGFQTHLLTPVTGAIVTVTYRMPFTGAQSISINANNAGTAGAVYHAMVTCLKVA